MRFIPVLLIPLLFLAQEIEVSAQDLFLVKIVSIDKEAKQVVATILDGPDALEDHTANSGKTISPEVTIASETLAMDFKPGDITRVWGVLSATGKDIIIQDSGSPFGGSDATGVRRRLRNNTNPRGSGGGGEEDMADHKKALPLWVANSLVFLILFLAVIAYFFWQNHLLKQAFLNHAQQHAAIVSEVIRLNAKGTLESLKSIEDILQNLLENTARFVSYLNRIEPFDQQELTAFAKESGLAGISIVRDNHTIVQGPENWKKDLSNLTCSTNPVIKHLPEEHLYLLASPEPGASGCLVLGINDEKIATLKKNLGLEHIINTISKVPGISYIRINQSIQNDTVPNRSIPIILTYKGEDVAEARQLIEGMELTVGVDAGHLAYFIKQLWIHLSLFSSFLVFAGVGLSIGLHRYQTAILNNVKKFERELSLQREDATLGRSAAAIAHEIRNPLNSLSIGLQRLEMENACGAQEHKKLIRQMRDAVLRANGSVTGLLNYARPRIPKIERVYIASLAMDLFNLYQKACETLQIRVITAFDFKGAIDCDPVLLGQVMENILKNAMEAQPGGGFIYCEIKKENREVALTFRNKGCTLSPEDFHRILEPYFTTRAEGTGLGMAIANTIIKALGGQINIKIMENGVIETRIYLPHSRNG